MKYNNEYSRFRMKGLSKNTIDFGLLCAAHNLRKWYIIFNLGVPIGTLEGNHFKKTPIFPHEK
ncbi:transposase [Bacillus salinus]|uniref:transposase n=1 Tax=Bacillus sp. HMF5848 TaxID=2495421 RepID=UPI0037BFFADB